MPKKKGAAKITAGAPVSDQKLISGSENNVAESPPKAADTSAQAPVPDQKLSAKENPAVESLSPPLESKRDSGPLDATIQRATTLFADLRTEFLDIDLREELLKRAFTDVADAKNAEHKADIKVGDLLVCLFQPGIKRDHKKDLENAITQLKAHPNDVILQHRIGILLLELSVAQEGIVSDEKLANFLSSLKGKSGAELEKAIDNLLELVFKNSIALDKDFLGIIKKAVPELVGRIKQYLEHRALTIQNAGADEKAVDQVKIIRNLIGRETLLIHCLNLLKDNPKEEKSLQRVAKLLLSLVLSQFVGINEPLMRAIIEVPAIKDFFKRFFATIKIPETFGNVNQDNAGLEQQKNLINETKLYLFRLRKIIFETCNSRLQNNLKDDIQQQCHAKLLNLAFERLVAEEKVTGLVAKLHNSPNPADHLSFLQQCSEKTLATEASNRQLLETLAQLKAELKALREKEQKLGYTRTQQQLLEEQNELAAQLAAFNAKPFDLPQQDHGDLSSIHRFPIIEAMQAYLAQLEILQFDDTVDYEPIKEFCLTLTGIDRSQPDLHLYNRATIEKCAIHPATGFKFAKSSLFSVTNVNDILKAHQQSIAAKLAEFINFVKGSEAEELNKLKAAKQQEPCFRLEIEFYQRKIKTSQNKVKDLTKKRKERDKKLQEKAQQAANSAPSSANSSPVMQYSATIRGTGLPLSFSELVKLYNCEEKGKKEHRSKENDPAIRDCPIFKELYDNISSARNQFTRLHFDNHLKLLLEFCKENNLLHYLNSSIITSNPFRNGTLFHLAAHKGNVTAVSMLLKFGAKKDKECDYYFGEPDPKNGVKATVYAIAVSSDDPDSRGILALLEPDKKQGDLFFEAGNYHLAQAANLQASKKDKKDEHFRLAIAYFQHAYFLDHSQAKIALEEAKRMYKSLLNADASNHSSSSPADQESDSKSEVGHSLSAANPRSSSSSISSVPSAASSYASIMSASGNADQKNDSPPLDETAITNEYLAILKSSGPLYPSEIEGTYYEARARVAARSSSSSSQSPTADTVSSTPSTPKGPGG